VIGFTRTSEELACDGVSLTAIAAAEGTPVYVYSAATIVQRYRDLDAAFGDYPHAIHYAFKANSTRALVSLLKAQGSAVDAVSMWEVEVARKAGFAPRQIVFDGVGKSDAELESAVALDLKAINVESAGECFCGFDRESKIDCFGSSRCRKQEPTGLPATGHPAKRVLPI